MDHPGLFTAGGETAAPAEFLAAIQKVLEVRTSSDAADCSPEMPAIAGERQTPFCDHM